MRLLFRTLTERKIRSNFYRVNTRLYNRFLSSTTVSYMICGENLISSKYFEKEKTIFAHLISGRYIQKTLHKHKQTHTLWSISEILLDFFDAPKIKVTEIDIERKKKDPKFQAHNFLPAYAPPHIFKIV